MFSKKEQEFIKNHKEILYSTMNWEPISIIRNNKISGFIYEYLKIIEEKSGLKFKFINSSSWDEIKSKFNDKKIVLFPKTSNINTDTKNYLLSNEISHYN